MYVSMYVCMYVCIYNAKNQYEPCDMFLCFASTHIIISGSNVQFRLINDSIHLK
jgi:hypothetical protein